ncbi:hypothetical protein BESB_059920 [Besnoitia besnoiti]|uniref:Uncharacterized protein n=1 Tax=Besnoitia besnoiti TaxID=94643 RepID=A0A2A9MAU3_BESBE|nr:hypothetical protein BESB_059920 [Besnoitia besnoiti]PFH35105.1 hypothetical protein BESB_059920 [Besnoitia besnoiti]
MDFSPSLSPHHQGVASPTSTHHDGDSIPASQAFAHPQKTAFLPLLSNRSSSTCGEQGTDVASISSHPLSPGSFEDGAGVPTRSPRMMQRESAPVDASSFTSSGLRSQLEEESAHGVPCSSSAPSAPPRQGLPQPGLRGSRDSVAALLGFASSAGETYGSEGRRRSRANEDEGAGMPQPRRAAAGAGGSRYTGREREEAACCEDAAASASLYRQRQQGHQNLFRVGGEATRVVCTRSRPAGRGETQERRSGGTNGGIPREEHLGAEHTEPLPSGRVSAVDPSETLSEGLEPVRATSFAQETGHACDMQTCMPAGVRTELWHREEENRQERERAEKRHCDGEMRRTSRERQGGWRAPQQAEFSHEDPHSMSATGVAQSGPFSPRVTYHGALQGAPTPRQQTLHSPPVRSGASSASFRRAVPPLDYLRQLQKEHDGTNSVASSLPPSPSFPHFPFSGRSLDAGRPEPLGRFPTSSPSPSALSHQDPHRSPSAFSSRSRSSYTSSSFSPKRDERNSRVKKLDELKSSGSVLPVSAAVHAAVETAFSAASVQGMRRQALWGEEAADERGDTALHRRMNSSGGDELPFPLNQMMRRREYQNKSDDSLHGQPRALLLPQDISWQSGAANIMSSRSSLGRLRPRTSPSQLSSSSEFCGSSPSSSPSSFVSAGAGAYGPGRDLTARERSLAQFRGAGEILGSYEGAGGAESRHERRQLSDGLGARRGDDRDKPLAQPPLSVAEENERRREVQRQNPWYTDLFGRETPTASRPAAASEVRRGYEAPGDAGVQVGCWDRRTGTQRRAELQEAKTAHEQFIKAMHSDVFSSEEPSAAAQRTLERAEVARTCLLREKTEARARRLRLQEAIESGGARLFHSVTGEETNLPGANGEKLYREAAHLPCKVVELHLAGIRPDMTEDDIRRICGAVADTPRVSPTSRSAFWPSAPSTVRSPAQSPLGPAAAGGKHLGPGTGRSGDGASLNCVVKVSLVRDLLTNQCKGTGRLVLRCHESHDEDEIVRRLSAAKVFVQSRDVTVDTPQLSARGQAGRR